MPNKHKLVKCLNCSNMIRKGRTYGLCRQCYETHSIASTDPPTKQVETDRQRVSHTTALSALKLKYAEALRIINRQEADLRTLTTFQEQNDPITIEPKYGLGTSEGTVCALASDWHVEEIVGSEVGGLNRYTPEIAEKCAKVFFQGVHRLTKLLQQDIRIDTLILALLGDFITGNIHGEENAEKNRLLPTDAIMFSISLVTGGIEFLLTHTDLDLVLPCHSGNHSRTTKKTRFASENGHSLEYLMYRHLTAYFRNEPRVTFLVAEGMHSYVEVYGQTIRFQHGHAIKYGGGVGGIYIPTNKAIAQWNKAKRADLDVFGHFHQLRDGGNFICNGSMIGYNAFAQSIKADFEPPKQALFLMDKKRGRTCTWPILFPPR